MFRSRFQSTALIAAIGALGALSTGTAHAATAFVDVNVTATVVATCTISKQADVAFSTTIDATASATLLAEGTVRLTCNKGAAPTIAINNGNNFASGSRNMKNGSNDLLAYSLKQPTGAAFATCPAAGAGTDWIGATTLAVSSLYSSNGGPADIQVCGQLVTPQLGATSGAYTDVVRVTATF